jgi:hypothetical protein
MFKLPPSTGPGGHHQSQGRISPAMRRLSQESFRAIGVQQVPYENKIKEVMNIPGPFFNNIRGIAWKMIKI